MSSAPLIRIGLIGCGSRLRGVARHLLNTAHNGGLQVTGLFDPDPSAVDATQTHLGIRARAYPDANALIQSSDVDWVMISSWNSQHADQAIAALAAGKHVFCEKPLATTLADCVRLREALVAAPDRHFFFGLVLRYTALYQRVKTILDAGSIGRILSFEFNETLDFNHGGYIHGNWRRHREHAGTHLLEKCCHDFDLVNWLLASVPVRAASFGGKDFFRPENRHLADRIGANANGAPAYSTWPDPHRVDPFSDGATIVDNQVAILEYANGARATFHTNCNAAIPERRMYLLGTEGTLRVDAITGRIEWQRIGHGTQSEIIDVAGKNEAHLGGDLRMATCLAETMLENAPPLATLEDGVRAAVGCFGVDEALDTGRVIDLRPLWNAAHITL